MKVVFISNFFTHLQKPISDELYKVCGGDYLFVSTKELSQERKSLGFDELKPSYVVQYNSFSKMEIEQKINGADFVIIGAAPMSLIKERLKLGRLTFRYSERFFKSYSRYLKFPFRVWESYKTRNCYFLCAGAYASKDVQLTGFFKNKCFKWGYFPEVKIYNDLDRLLDHKISKVKNGKVSIVWAARLIRLKHPEYLLELARRLKDNNYLFEVHMLGNGVLEDDLRKSVNKMNLNDCLFIHGATHPDKVRAYMEEADIFIFTSDRHEGWGAVINESMNSACAVVASHAAGSVPFLIRNNVNGMVFKSGNVDDLYEKTKILIENPTIRKSLAINAYKTMTDVWNATNIVKNLFALADSILKQKDIPELNGPCSKADVMKDNWLEQ